MVVVHGQPNAPHGGDDDDDEVEMVTDDDGYGSGGTRRLKMVDRDIDDKEMEMLQRCGCWRRLSGSRMAW
ncbi:hypothetical protein Tco_0382820 [Tanacetum coccineum]